MHYQRLPVSCRPAFIAALLAGRLFVCGAAGAADGADRHPLAPPDLSSPRAALHSFRDRCDALFAELGHGETSTAHTQRIRRMAAAVTSCLDLDEIPPALVESKGRQAAVCLKEVLDRIELPATADLPSANDGQREGLKRWRLPHTEIYLVRIPDGPRGGEWLFSSDTVEQADNFYRRIRDLPYRPTAGSPGFYDFYVQAAGWMIPEPWLQALPAWAKATVWEETVWRWLSLLLLLAAGAGIVAGMFRWSRRAAARGGFVAEGLACAAPASLIAAGFLLDYLFTYQIRLTGNAIFTTKAVLGVLEFFGAAMLVLWALRRAADLVIRSQGFRPGTIDTQLVRLGFKILTALAVAWMVIIGADSVGISVAPLIAGLGVGGLAVALAAQHTVENVIAGLVLFADKPVRIGDACRFGDVRGTVEQIGLRSTRIRCADRTVITIPNSEFAKLQLTNFSCRDRILLQSVLTLRYETTADQMRYLLAALRDMLGRHPRIAADSVRVRFVGYGEWSLNVEIFALAETTDFNEFLAIQEDVLLLVMGMVHEAGCDFAFPSQTQYAAHETGLDAARCQRAEETVAGWRREGVLRTVGFLDAPQPAPARAAA